MQSTSQQAASLPDCCVGWTCQPMRLRRRGGQLDLPFLFFLIKGKGIRALFCVGVKVSILTGGWQRLKERIMNNGRAGPGPGRWLSGYRVLVTKTDDLGLIPGSMW